MQEKRENENMNKNGRCYDNSPLLPLLLPNKAKEEGRKAIKIPNSGEKNRLVPLKVSCGRSIAFIQQNLGTDIKITCY